MGEVVKIDIVIETLCDFVDLFGEVGDLLYQPMVLLVDLCNLLAVFLLLFLHLLAVFLLLFLHLLA